MYVYSGVKSTIHVHVYSKYLVCMFTKDNVFQSIIIMSSVDLKPAYATHSSQARSFPKSEILGGVGSRGDPVACSPEKV